MSIKFELPLEALEPLFIALSTIRPTACSRTEQKALMLLKSAIYFELERIMETIEEKEEKKIDFETLFREEKDRRMRERYEKAGNSRQL